jgi:peptide/nickel transport system permease protein
MSVIPLEGLTEPATNTGGLRRRLRALRTPGGVFAVSWLLLLLIASLTAPLWIPYPVGQQDLAHALSGPTGEHWLGTDALGRDVFSRIFAAAWISVGPALLAMLVAFGIGVPLALLAAEHGRRLERFTSRGTEVLLALPGTVIILAVIGAIGINPWAIMVFLGILLSAPVYRVLLGVAQSIRKRLYVDAARVNGLGSLAVNVKYVLPGMATIVAVQAAQLFGIAILIEAGLAFIGFGPQVPSPSWGGLIADASKNVFNAPWLMVPTGVVLALTVIAANELADAIAGETKRGTPSRRKARVVATARTPASATHADVLLEVSDLTVSVADGPVLVSDVSFAVQPGRVLGLVGESGCGKTMTARSLLGLLPDGVAVTGGSICFEGRDLVGLSERQLRPVRGRQVTLISQEPMVALDPLFSVAHQLTQPIRRLRGVGRREARTIAAALLGQVGIVDVRRVLRSYPHQLSGGMAQRVCIALALTGQPKLLVADEPTTALDVTIQAEILSLLRALVQDTGLSVIVVSHDLGVVADLCDDVAVMYAGQIVESGSAADVLERPRHPYTAALLGANPHVPEDTPVPGRLVSIPGAVPAPGHWPGGCRFASRCAFATEECSQPIALTAEHGDGSVRCIHPVTAATAGALKNHDHPKPITGVSS